jgi:predicted phage tail protein
LITFSPFVGIFVTVVTVITIIVFFVLVGSSDPAIRLTAITLGSVTELVLYSLSTSAVLIGIVQVRPRL